MCCYDGRQGSSYLLWTHTVRQYLESSERKTPQPNVSSWNDVSNIGHALFIEVLLFDEDYDIHFATPCKDWQFCGR